MNNISYAFNQYETALTAFVGDVDKKINSILESVPVFVLDSGDVTYIFKEKFEITENQEIYLHNPRCVISFGDSTLDKTQDTSQNTEITYKLSDSDIFSTKATRKATNFAISLGFVCSNYIKSLEYLEILQTLFVRENVGTYVFLGNNYPFSYIIDSQSIVKNDIDANSKKNCVVKLEINLQLQPMIIKHQSIKQLSGNIKGSDALTTNFHLVARYGDTKTSTPPDYEDNFKGE